MTKKLSWALAGAGAILAVSLSGAAVHFDFDGFDFARDAEATQAEAAPAPAIPVTVTAVEPRSITTWQEFSGRLEAVDRVQLRPRVAGTIQAVHFREGGLVSVGDRLITIDPAPYAAAVAQAEGQVASAKARLDLAATELRRGKTLLEKKTISQSELAQRQGAEREAAASLRSAEAALELAQINLGYTEIKAPISGRVGRLEITEGNLVGAGDAAQVLTTLVSVDPIYASFDAGEDIVARILAELPSQGGVRALEQVPVEIQTLGGEEAVRGRLQLIDNEVSATSGTIRLRAIFDNPDGRLIPGQFVRVRLGEPKEKEHLLVSETAVGSDQDKKFVFVVDQANTVAYRQIKLGAAVEGERIVESGLQPGDRVVVNGLQRIRPGAVVEPQTAAEVAKK
ncbi:MULTISPECIES: efflux RND transporter periplasmic adaptor subunit [Pseudorhizobium]|uniref:Multidrug efflux system membrane fusion protein n=2 Tax=Pseudorhizobium TaxID=1903858 RepID=A0A7X0DE13_9HYPH|nr:MULTISPECIES: efflux RND transporter periplasmic adaptor subunit [Pseudorhizobium]MBB6181503.1 multidrug efflux system membrane fusion protein [Pseudorhizobium flavum]CAD6616842.1 efflux RND transporter periplasmic adaptor subunit [Pseudorhizobium flavum]CAD7051260.1 efflux RND transporter periplasmic adaptor subunit [Pseudorhizobium halotolerans]